MIIYTGIEIIWRVLEFGDEHVAYPFEFVRTKVFTHDERSL
jgi:hypothetical protein